MSQEQKVSPQTLQRFYESLTDIIYEYLCYHRIDKASLPLTQIINVIRDRSMACVKEMMDIAIAINHGNNFKCPHCKTNIEMHEDCQTGACWDKCENKECSQYNVTFTYVNKEDYREF